MSPPPILVRLSHADPSVLPRYRDAIAARGLDADVVLVNRFVAGKLSSAYRELAAELRTRGGILAGLRSRFPGPRPEESYGLRVAASFSAGYGLWAELFASREDVSTIDGYVGLDSFHTPLDADGTASDAALAPLVALALSAREGKRVVWYGHSDVATPQKAYRDAAGRLVQPYASTTQVAAELLRLAGGEGGGFRVEAHDETREQAREHGLALTGWGPAFLASALARLVELRVSADAQPDTAPSPSTNESLGALALRIAGEELDAGRGESPPGSNGGPDVERYFSGCERDGKPLPLKAGEWCAAGASWCAFQAARRTGGRVPHRWRASVLELWRDACSAEFGSARSAEDVRAGRYVPKPGDLWIGVRGGSSVGKGPRPEDAFALTGGKGHVGRFRVSPDGAGRFATRDANHGSAWGDVPRFLSDPEFVGVIAHADPPRPPNPHEVAAIERLLRLTDPTAPTGIDAIEEVLRRPA